VSVPPKDWTRWRQQIDLDGYDERWRRLAAAGHNPHGEADMIAGLGPGSVLDGGCGTGRLAIELARRGIAVLGVDSDRDMIEAAGPRPRSCRGCTPTSPSSTGPSGSTWWR
jgi:2-polyprenyl-3-methyl-5-hydroxy-6-metoxy-1,4-benzoquinol methylase